jgi:hypothetical protein
MIVAPKRIRPSVFSAYVREEVLDTQISKLLASYTLQEDWAETLPHELKRKRKNMPNPPSPPRFSTVSLSAKFTPPREPHLWGKSLGGTSSTLLKNRNAWLEPFKEWIVPQKTRGKSSIGFPHGEKGFASKVFGSNLSSTAKRLW